MKIENTNQLRELYDFPSGRAKDKSLLSLEKHTINFIEKSPFLVISTYDKNGKVDASPRGGKSGFVKILSNHEIVIPDSKGNNRIDSLINIVDTGRIGMLFLIPGVDETLRINGRAYISTELRLLDLFSAESNPPKSCIVIDIEEVFLHCAKALMRSNLWDENSKINRSNFPTIGQMLKDQLGTSDEIESQEAMLKRYKKDL